MYILVGILLLTVLSVVLFNHKRKRKVCEKLCAMSCEEKCSLISELTEPFGYCYVPSQDIFSTTVDAPQRTFGYTALFDRYASHFNMIFDCLPVYFDYEGHTWLIEFWKGQYGINLGCETGIYQADSLISSIQQDHALFHSVTNAQMLPLSVRLFRGSIEIAHLRARHWWLTAFDMGSFANPAELSMCVSITFPNRAMLHAFVNALAATGKCQYKTCGMTVQVSFAYCTSCTLPPLRRLYHRLVQRWNKLQCRLFLWTTRPFTSSLDRLLCLYFYLPPVFRHILQNKKRDKCRNKSCKRCRGTCRNKRGKKCPKKNRGTRRL